MSGGEPLALLVEAVEAFCRDFQPDEDSHEAGVQLVRMREVIDRLEVSFSQLSATFAATEEFENDGAVSAIDWIRHHAKMSGSEAARRVCVGEQLERMPQFVESLFEGRVGFGHLVNTAYAARKLCSSGTGEGFDEADLLEQAEALSVGKFLYACRHYVHSRDPRGTVADEVEAAQMREVSITTGADGRVHMHADLDPEGGAVVRTALESLARPNGAGDRRSHAQRMGDALIEGLLHTMNTGALPTRGGQRVHLQVTASYDTLKGNLRAPAADMEFSLPISGEKARRWACDCSLTRILLDSDSIPIDVGREKRIVSGALRKAVNLLYPCCAYDGCDRTASWTEAHHIRHWIDGGLTELQNIVPLCFRHHVMVHEGGYTIEVRDGQLIFVPPAGNQVICERDHPDIYALV